MNSEQIKITGRVTYKLCDQFGNLKEERVVPNLIVTVGKNFLASWIAATSQASPFMPYVALGSGSTPVLAGDTTLGIEAATRVQGTITSSLNVWQNQVVFVPGINTGVITEAGLFSANAGGVMMARQVFGVINKGALDELTVTWQIAFS